MKKLLTLTFALIAVGAYAQGRITESLNDGWQFKRGPFAEDRILFMNSTPGGKWANVQIPHTWNALDMQRSRNAFYAGDALYRKSYQAPAGHKEKRTYLRFEGVGQVAELYVNGRFAGRHKGGYSAFCFEITSLLNYGEENQIVVMANNEARQDVIPINHSLFGVYGGIYRPVSMIVTDKVNITPTDYASTGVYVHQKNVSAKSADVSIEVKLDNGTRYNSAIELENTIYDMSGKEISTSRTPITLTPQGLQSHTANFTVKKPHLWNGRKDPYLYKIETKLYQNGALIDKVVSPLGLRTIEVKANDGVYLNGEKYPMYGVCRHQDRQGIGSALLNEHHDEDLEMIMEIGATTVRFAHYQQSDYLYSKCDSLGLIIWAEIPFVNRVSTHETENAKSQLSEMILQSYNHPSIYVWGLHNEVYTPSNYTAELTKELHTLAKVLDPGRYTVSVNGYGTMERPENLQADIQGMNRYFGWYEGKLNDMDTWAKKLATNYPDVKLMLTEYGADANIYHQSELTGESYDPFNDFFPEGYVTKTHERHWGIISRNPYILSSYIWNMFDFAVPMWERGGIPARNMKGIITFDRKIKKDSFYWYKANWSKEPVLYLTGRRATERERQETTITVYSNIGEPKVTLNGQELTGIKKGETDVHYVLEKIKLVKGKNTIIATAPDGTKDEIVWNYEKDSDNKLLNELERKGEHSGF